MIVIWLVLVLLVAAVVYLRRNYGTLEDLGIPVVQPGLFWGSIPLLVHNYTLIDLDYDLFRKYGKVYGAYALDTPWVFISDADMLRQITVKDHDHFPGHHFTISDKKYQTIDTVKGENWKDLRKGLSPTFTSGKIKGMLSQFGSCLDNMVDNLEQQIKSNHVVDLKPVFQCLTLDIISRSAFGLEANTHVNPEGSQLFRMAKELATESTRVDNLKETLMMHFFSLVKGHDFPVPASFEYFWRFTRSIQDQRAASGVEVGDFIDRLNDMRQQLKKGDMPTVTEDQITAQGIVFLLAGYETTANALGSLVYHLVKNPEVLATLVREVEDTLEAFQGRVDHETIAGMIYLDACVREGLRILPPAARNERVCGKDWEYKGIKIKQGMSIGISIYVVHHDPDYWPEPELFRPERFLKENASKIVPCSWIPFGAGPRACIGERFALVEIKMAMVKLLQNFNIEADESTRLNLMKGDLFLSSYTDMNIKLTSRM